MMKRLTILFAVAAMFATTSVSAQGTKEQADKNGGMMKDNQASPKIYGEITVFSVNGRTTVKVDFNPLIQKITADKTAFKTCTNLENYQYESLGEALNILSSHGWSVEHVWTEEKRTGVDTNFLIAKPVGRLTPVNPWLDKSKSSKGGVTRGK